MALDGVGLDGQRAKECIPILEVIEHEKLCQIKLDSLVEILDKR